MPKPYYEQDGITIYHGDSKSVLDDIHADVLVTDSPYGVNLGKVKDRLVSEGYASYEDTPEQYLELVVPIIRKALALTKRAGVFAPFKQLTYLPPPRMRRSGIQQGRRWAFAMGLHATTPDLPLWREPTA